MRQTPTSIILELQRHGGEEVEFTWSTIQRISAFKQDLFNPQVVIMEISTADGSWEVEANDCAGFIIFAALCCHHLPQMPPHDDWWPRVTDPLGRQEDVLLYSAAASPA